MASHTRTAALLALVAVALAGCSLFGPARDENGRVTEPAEIRSTALTVGDCFSFIDGTNLAEATVMPCDLEHSHIVIGQGQLTDAEIDSAGGLQNAVSSSCAEPFEEFTAAAAEGTRPEQEFIVSRVEVEETEVTRYSCIATDNGA